MTRKETDGFWWKSGPRYVSVKIRVRIGLAQGLAPRGCTAVLRKGRRATRNLFSNNFASSAALAEVCALPSAVLVIYFLKYSATRWPYVSLCVAFILGMCGMDFSSSVQFRFGFDKNRGFGSVSVSVRFEKNRRFGSVIFVDHS